MRVCGNLVAILPCLLCIVDTAGAAIGSFQKELQITVCSFLEVLVIYDAQNDNPVLKKTIESNSAAIMKECVGALR